MKKCIESNKKESKRNRYRIAACFTALFLSTLPGCGGKEYLVTIQDGEMSYELTEKKSRTVAELLEEAGVELESGDETSPALDQKLSENTEIMVSRSVTVTVSYDGKETEVSLLGGTVKDACKEAGLKEVNPEEVNFDLEEALKDGMEIKVKKVERKTIEETQTVAYPTETKKTSSLKKGKTKIKQKGQEGEKKLVYEVTYVDGKETKKELQEEIIIKEPVTEVILKGTKTSKNKTSKETEQKNSNTQETVSSGQEAPAQ